MHQHSSLLHTSTVVNAGRFDGPLGVLLAIDLVDQVLKENKSLPFTIEVVAFSDEEGVRFHTTYLGSKVLAGSFDTQLSLTDKDGISLQEAIAKVGGNAVGLRTDMIKDELLGYFEIHIEQGPVLYESGVPVAAVKAIAGQKRIELVFTGTAGHAGTVPMEMRHDALCCAAACISGIEDFAIDHSSSIIATVGMLQIENAASNVIPGKVTCTLDIRSSDDTRLNFACNALQNIIHEICEDRQISFAWNMIQETAPVACSEELTNLLKESIANAGFEVTELVSGAGHDAVALSAICPVYNVVCPLLQRHQSQPA